MKVLTIAFAFIFYYAGFWMAHAEVARECERIGAFYVNDATYQCSLKERAK